MRTVLIALLFIIFFILSIPLFLLELIIGVFSIRARTRLAQTVISIMARAVLWFGGVSVTAIGMENVPKDEAVVYIFNHRSYFDIVISYATVPNLAGFISMKKMKDVPFINVWMKFLQCLFIDRGNTREGLKTINAGIELLKKGHSIFIAPEGKRNFKGDFDMLPFKEGSFRLAKKTGCAIIPVAINNADKIYEAQAPWVRKTNVIIEYGKPIYIKDLSDENRKFVGAYVQSIIQNMLEKNQNILNAKSIPSDYKN